MHRQNGRDALDNEVDRLGRECVVTERLRKEGQRQEPWNVSVALVAGHQQSRSGNAVSGMASELRVCKREIQAES